MLQQLDLALIPVRALSDLVGNHIPQRLDERSLGFLGPLVDFAPEVSVQARDH